MDGVYMIPSSVHEFLLLVMDKEYVNCGVLEGFLTVLIGDEIHIVEILTILLGNQ